MTTHAYGEGVPARGERLWSLNWSMSPNEFWDDFAALLTPYEMAALGFVARHWFGWQSVRSSSPVPISLDEFMEGKWVCNNVQGSEDVLNAFGLERSQKHRVGRGLRMCRPTLRTALAALVKFGVLIRIEAEQLDADGAAAFWALPANDRNVDYDGLEARLAADKEKCQKRVKKSDAKGDEGSGPASAKEADSEAVSGSGGGKGKGKRGKAGQPKAKRVAKPKPKKLEVSDEERGIRLKMRQMICWMLLGHTREAEMGPSRPNVCVKVEKWRTSEDPAGQADPDTLAILWNEIWGKKHFNKGLSRANYSRAVWSDIYKLMPTARLKQLGKTATPIEFKDQGKPNETFVQKPKRRTKTVAPIKPKQTRQPVVAVGAISQNAAASQHPNFSGD